MLGQRGEDLGRRQRHDETVPGLISGLLAMRTGPERPGRLSPVVVPARVLARALAQRGEDAIVEAVEMGRHLGRRLPRRGSVAPALALAPGDRRLA